MADERVTTATFKKYHTEGKKITMLTAYDHPTAMLVDGAGIDAILVGDSMGTAVLGYDSTVPVTMDVMVHHVKAVVRGVKRAMVVADMPFLSYQISKKEAVRNAGRLLQEAGAQAVKLEGGAEVAEAVGRITAAGIPVVGHLGLTPQSINVFGGYKVQGKDSGAAQKLLDDARALEEAGAFAVVLECVPVPLAKLVTERIGIPTIGIGAGPYCSGQVLVIHDMLGFSGRFAPKFVKRYANLHEIIIQSLCDYRDEVENSTFPGPEYSFAMDETVLKNIK